jgi:hypothetical protein
MISLPEQDCNKKNLQKEVVPTGRMPDFLIIGAMKSGTTSLFELLGRQPQIFLPRWKEPQYFSRDNKFSLGEKWYQNLFIDAREDQLIGEASTCYSRWPLYSHAAERIAARLPDVRLIYLMRHPVERAYSHYGHLMQERMIKRKGEILTFEEALEKEKEIIDTSLYMMQVKKYLEFFPQDQMFFLTLDELKSRPAELLLRIQDFLRIEPCDLTAGKEIKANPWGHAATKVKISEFVVDMSRIPVLSRVVTNVIPKDMRQSLKKVIFQSRFLYALFNSSLKKKKKHLSPLTGNTREKLLVHFKEPTRQLEDFLGLKLDSWYE